MKKNLIAFAALLALSVSAHAGSAVPVNELAESFAASFFIISIYAIYWLKENLAQRDAVNAR